MLHPLWFRFIRLRTSYPAELACTPNHTTPSRRAALGFSLAAIAAGLTVPALASVATTEPSPDAELNRLSDRIVAIQAEQNALFAVRHTVEDEERTDPEMNALYAERTRIFDLLFDLLDPTTLAGARAMARASIAIAPRERDGTISWSGGSGWLAWSAADFLAGSVAA
jgi:hypothetical protein